MVIPYQSVDQGYVFDPSKKLDCLMSDFFEAEYSQSYLFYGSITSLPWIIQTYQSDPTVAASKIREHLMKYLEKYFDFVEVETGVMDNASATSYSLRLYIHVTQGTSSVKWDKALRITGTQFEKSIAIRT